MGSCRKFKIFIVIFFIALSISCSNFINLTSNIDDEEVELAGETETGVITAKNDKESVYVKLNILGYTDSMENNSRTLLPPEEDGSSVSKYALFGFLRSTQMNDYEVSSDKQELGSWTDYSQMIADSVEIIPGTWDFSLFAYKNVNGEDKIYATALIENQEVGDQTGSLELDFTFTFDNSDFNTGSLNVTINVPYNQVTRALVSLYTYNASNQKVFQNLTNSIYTPSGGSAGVNSSFTISESAIPVGYYFLKVDFYTSSTTSPSASRVQYVKILGGQNTGGNLTYTQLNNSYSILYHDSISGDTDEVVNNSINPSSYNNSTSVSLEDASCQHYEFGGWYENADFSGSPVSSWAAGEKNENLVLYAKWTPKSYPVVFHDWAAGQTSGKTYSGTYDGFETSATAASGYCLTYKARLPSSSFDTVANPLIDSNTVEFVGWFSNQDCTSASAISSNAKVNDSILTDSDGDGELDTLDLYAKWNYSYVYVDPSSRNTACVATDENRGFSPNQALLTVEEAKKYLQGNDKAKYVYLLSTAILDGSSSVNNPSEISDKSIYGDGTNSVIVMRHSTSLDQPLFTITSAGSAITLKNVIIDGGAIWNENGAAGTNSGLRATSVLINAFNESFYTKLILDENVVLQNNDREYTTTGSTRPEYTVTGSGIYIQGELTSNSNTNQIRTCCGIRGCAIQLFNNSKLNFYKGIIGGSSAKDANCSKMAGAAINCDYVTTPSNPGAEVILGSATNASDGSDVKISYNKCGSDGVVVIYGYSTLKAYNITISNNSGNSRCSGLYIMHHSEGEVTGSFIKNNELTQSISGGSVYVGSDSTLKMSDVEISSNVHSNGPGAAIYLDRTDVNVYLNNVTLKDNFSPSSGSDIYNYGNLYISGKNSLGDIYMASSNGYIYPRNYYDSTGTGTSSISSPLQVATGSYMGTITHVEESNFPTNDYDPADSSTYIQVLNETTSGDMSGLTSLFKLNVSTHKINSEGRIISRSSNYNNNITDPSTTQLYFGISSATVSSSANQPELTITAYSDSTKTLEATSASSWWCTLLYNGLTNTGAELNDVGTNGAQKSIHFYTDNINFQPGSYILTVGASINGTAYSDSFTITVN